jgi:hypothetical protein
MLNHRTGSRRGTALLTVLTMMMVLGIVLKSLTFLLGSRAFSVRSNQDLAESRFLAEAGLARVQQELTRSAAWAGTFTNEHVGDSVGTYSVHFSTNPGPSDSANNMVSAVPGNGPRGPGTVPPYTSDVVVTGRCNGKTYVLEALVSRRLEDTAAVAIASTGRVFMDGNVEVSGVRAFTDATDLPTGIHSNSEALSTCISWTGTGSQRLRVSGDLSATSTAADAILLSGTHTERGVKIAQPPVEFPRVDIRGRVKDNNSRPAAPFASLGTSNLAAGEFYQAGSTTVNGDVILHDTTLYVNGDLSVNGSISGTGSVFVTGTTTLRGDSHVSTTNSEGVALYSHDSVSLLGFDGNAYLQEFCAANPTAGDLLLRVQAQMERVTALGHPLTRSEHFKDTMTSVRLHLGYEDGEDDKKLLKKLRSEIENTAVSGETRDWIMRRMDNLRAFFDDAETVGGNDGARASFLRDPMPKGFAEVLSEDGDDNSRFFRQHREEIWALLDELNFNKIGTSYFQGVIRTHGSFYAANEITVLGSIGAYGDGALGTVVRGGRTLAPGDIFVQNGVTLKFSKEYALTQGGPEAGALPAMLRVWIPR